MNVSSGPDTRPKRNQGTRDRLLAIATEAFADRGFDVVTVREITRAAGTNPATINYHFGSKEQLIAEVFERAVRPVNEQRLAALRRHVTASEPESPAGEAVVRAFVEPVVRSALKAKRSHRGTYHRFHILAYALRRPFVDKMMSAQSDSVAVEFIDALGKAFPQSSRAAVCWRFDFMIGALVHILLDADRSSKLKRLSSGLCDTSDPDAITAELTDFVVAGFGTTGSVSPVEARTAGAARVGSPSERRIRREHA